MDLFWFGDYYVLLCDLLGIDLGLIDIGVDGCVLIIWVERTRCGDDVEWLM